MNKIFDNEIGAAQFFSGPKIENYLHKPSLEIDKLGKKDERVLRQEAVDAPDKGIKSSESSHWEVYIPAVKCLNDFWLKIRII